MKTHYLALARSALEQNKSRPPETAENSPPAEAEAVEPPPQVDFSKAAEAEVFVPWEDSLEPRPCDSCGCLEAWLDLLGFCHCFACEPPETAIRVREDVLRIRRRRGLPVDREAVEHVRGLKAIADSCRDTTCC